MENRQFRAMELLTENNQNEFNSDYYVEGYAAKYEPYPLYEDSDGVVYERFDKASFAGTDMTDVIFLYDHQGKVLARTSNGTLNVLFDETGMFIKADLSKSQAARDMYSEIQEGLVTKMSWSFKVGDYHFEESTRTIVHDSVKKVYDVSAVGIPANNDTSINARSFADGVISQVQAERLKRERKAKLLKLKIEMEQEQ